MSVRHERSEANSVVTAQLRTFSLRALHLARLLGCDD
jgi:hypothetical protein